VRTARVAFSSNYTAVSASARRAYLYVCIPSQTLTWQLLKHIDWAAGTEKELFDRRLIVFIPVGFISTLISRRTRGCPASVIMHRVTKLTSRSHERDIPAYNSCSSLCNKYYLPNGNHYRSILHQNTSVNLKNSAWLWKSTAPFRLVDKWVQLYDRNKETFNQPTNSRANRLRLSSAVNFEWPRVMMLVSVPVFTATALFSCSPCARITSTYINNVIHAHAIFNRLTVGTTIRKQRQHFVMVGFCGKSKQFGAGIRVDFQNWNRPRSRNAYFCQQQTKCWL